MSTDKRKKTVTVYDKGGNAVHTFESVNEAAVFLDTVKGTVSRALNGNRKTCMGYVVRYGDSAKIEEFTPTYTDKRTVVQCDSSGNTIKTWGSVHDAARGVSTDPSNISKCLRGHKKTCAGFCWRYG